MYNTRIAPSPSGDLHIGNVRTAYFNWLAARSTGGKFILRIDDTDAVRSKQEYVDVITETMKWLGLNYDELIHQSSRFDRYLFVAKEWVNKGFAYVEDDAIKFKITRPELPSYWNDEISGSIKITDDDFDKIDGTVLIRKDKTPTYNWASVIDDMDFNINYIIRGTDHITNTSKQVVLWNLLGYQVPKFAHVGLIGVSGKPLSKRDGASSILHYKNAGYQPEAILNFLARNGPKIDDKTTKLLPREKMLDLFFKGGKMRSAMSGFDLQKLDSFDRKYKALLGQ